MLIDLAYRDAFQHGSAMKASAVAVSLLLSMKIAAQAQVFDAGYTFSYYFPSLPSSQQLVIAPETGLFILPAFQNVTATIQWEVFDSLAAGVPAHSGIFRPGDPAYVGLYDQTWLDGEGSFRISILSGSQYIQGYYIYVARPEATGYTVYSALISPTVPEPNSTALVAFAVLLAAAFRICRKVI